MGRDAVKARGNPWYEARLEAAKWDDRLASREGAAEQLGMSVDAVKNAELNLDKCMPVDKAVLMADLYKAPQLLNHYCLKECPIGCHRSISDEVLGIDRITVKLLSSMRVSQISSIKERLLQIAQDGVISDDELEDLQDITRYLGDLTKIVSELKTASEIALKRREKRCR